MYLHSTPATHSRALSRQETPINTSDVMASLLRRRRRTSELTWWPGGQGRLAIVNPDGPVSLLLPHNFDSTTKMTRQDGDVDIDDSTT
jgi:hypothetical protein